MYIKFLDWMCLLPMVLIISAKPRLFFHILSIVLMLNGSLEAFIEV